MIEGRHLVEIYRTFLSYLSKLEISSCFAVMTANQTGKPISFLKRKLPNTFAVEKEDIYIIFAA